MNLLQKLRKGPVIESEHLDVLGDIRRDEFNKREALRGGDLNALIDAFSYGVMIGKQLERAKKKALN